MSSITRIMIYYTSNLELGSYYVFNHQVKYCSSDTTKRLYENSNYSYSEFIILSDEEFSYFHLGVSLPESNWVGPIDPRLFSRRPRLIVEVPTIRSYAPVDTSCKFIYSWACSTGRTYEIKFWISNVGSVNVYINNNLDSMATAALSKKDKILLTREIIKRWRNEVLPSFEKGKKLSCTSYVNDNKGDKRTSLYKFIGFKQLNGCLHLVV